MTLAITIKRWHAVAALCCTASIFVGALLGALT